MLSVETQATISKAAQPDQFGRVLTLVITGISPRGRSVWVARNILPDVHQVESIVNQAEQSGYTKLEVSIESF